MNQVLVLLSAYNGELYIKEQIDSILRQENVYCRLLVRDDGSKDGTLKILSAYERQYPEKIHVEFGKNVGCVGSFYQLVQLAMAHYPEADFFAFSDQDDVWLKDKLSSAIARLSPLNQESPNLYGSDFEPVNGKLESLPFTHGHYYNTMGEACVINMILGCTMVFNRSAANLFLRAQMSDIPCLHDEWMYKACLAVGGHVVYDETPHILYRQHGDNVVGVNKGWLKRWQCRWRNFKNSYKKRSTTLTQIWRVYESEITADHKCVIRPLIAPGNFFRRLWIIGASVYRTHSRVNNILFRIAYLCNRY